MHKNINIEKAVLSSIIFEPSLFLSLKSSFDEKLFSMPAYRNIYIAIQDLVKNNLPIDEEFIKKSLIKNSKFDESALLDVLSANPLSNLDAYINELRDLYRKRELELLSLEIKKRLSDQNYSAADIEALLKKDIDELEKSIKKELFEIHDISTIEEQNTEFICKDWLPFPKRTVSMITAPGGTGKSWLVLQLGLRIIKEDITKKVFLWLSEDPAGLSKNRSEKILSDILNLDLKKFFGKLFISDSPTLHIVQEKGRGLEINALFYHVKSMLKPYDVIVLDPLIAFFGADENNNAFARKFMQLFTEWASSENKTIVFVHHSTKNTTQSRGASAFTDAVRLVYEMDKLRDEEGKEKETHMRQIKITKDNYGVQKILSSSVFIRQIFPKHIQVEITKYEEF